MLKLCDILDFPTGVAREATVDEKSYVVMHTSEGFKAYLNKCPHLGTPLNWQPDQFLDENNELLKCATHGALFLSDNGYCIQGPCTGQSLTAVPIEVQKEALYIKNVLTN